MSVARLGSLVGTAPRALACGNFQVPHTLKLIGRGSANERADAVWTVGRYTLGTLVRLLTPLRNYGVERVPRTGGVVLAFNHFHWIDPPVFGLLLAAARSTSSRRSRRTGCRVSAS